MKKIYNFLVNKTVLAITIAIFILVISSVGVIYDTENICLIISFGSSIAVCLSILEWKNGKLPFILSDRVWGALWHKDVVDREETHKRIMLAVAAFSFLVMVLTFVIGVVWLILSEILPLCS